ncbi:hypothetical protein J4228_03290 [Candidatus Woesearchaeota archaeon]|nr:hypothetical protein [Candidatus Woesearchaeota archaeon]
MEEEVKKELLYDLAEAIRILEEREEKDVEELKTLSDHAIDDVALHKDLDVVSITVLIYSLYKVISQMEKQDYDDLLTELKDARKNLEQGNLGKYNRSVKTLFDIVRRSSDKIKEHLQDVMHAARIKKGTALLQRGLSIGQAAGLMGLSNWDLQHYAGKTTSLEQHKEKISASKRLGKALKIFGI